MSPVNFEASPRVCTPSLSLCFPQEFWKSGTNEGRKQEKTLQTQEAQTSRKSITHEVNMWTKGKQNILKILSSFVILNRHLWAHTSQNQNRWEMFAAETHPPLLWLITLLRFSCFLPPNILVRMMMSDSNFYILSQLTSHPCPPTAFSSQSPRTSFLHDPPVLPCLHAQGPNWDKLNPEYKNVQKCWSNQQIFMEDINNKLLNMWYKHCNYSPPIGIIKHYSESAFSTKFLAHFLLLD